MADDVVASLGTLDGAKFATDDDGTRHWAYSKQAWGANNTQTPVSSGAAALPIQDGGNSITVDGTVAVTGVATAANQTSEIALLAGGLPAALAANGGLKVEGVAGGTAVPVSVASIPSHAVTNAGTFAVQESGSALTALQLIDDPVFADDSAFTVGTSKVMMAGGNAVAHGANPDAADAGDAGALLMSRHRIPFFIGGHPNIITLEAAYTTAQTDVAIVTVGAGAKIVVTQIQAVTSQANTVGVGLRVGFGTANTPTTTGVVLTHPSMVPGAGVSRGDGAGILGIGADNEDLRITSDVPTGGSLRILVSYYSIES